MARVFIEVRGKEHTWMVAYDAPKDQIDRMREDGLEVNEMMNTIPEWVALCYLTAPWCFLQDLWNFKNPFKK